MLTRRAGGFIAIMQMSSATDSPSQAISTPWDRPEFRPRVGVVGAGAVGCYYGAMLARAGIEVHFLLRSDYEEVRKEGLRIESVEGGDFQLHPVRCSLSPREIGECDLILVAIKSTANHVLPDLLRPMVGDNTAILTLQNGLGNDEFLAGHFGEERILGGLCFICLNRIKPGLIRHFGHGRLSFGEYHRRPGNRARRIEAMLSGASVNCDLVDDLALEQWRKLVWNIPFNGLSIAAKANVREVLDAPDLRTLAAHLMEEVVLAADALGHTIPADFVDYQLHRSESMGPYKPSSMIDYLAERPVEVEAIWGEPYRRGTNAGVELPRLGMLLALLRTLCK